MKDSRRVIKESVKSDAQVLELTDEELRKLKSALLGMLSDFLAFAEEEQIAYTLGGGSVLGAVRHKGYIPWDDDIDLNIPRADYERLRQLFPKKMGDRYLLCTPEDTPGHGMTSASIRKKGTILRSFNELSKPDEESGIGIDIFVIEDLPDSAAGRFFHGLACLAAGYRVTCKKTAHDMPWLRKWVPDDSRAGRIFRFKALISRLLCPGSLDRITEKAVRKYAYRNPDSAYVTVPSGRKHYFGEMKKREQIAESREAEFEGLRVRIPKDAEAYLTALYGPDYMTIPPEGKRESHPIMELRFGGKEE